VKSIETLIKVHKSNLDEKRQELARLEGQKDEMLGYSKKMAAELQREAEFAATDPSVSMTFENYRRMINERQNNIFAAVSDIDKQITPIRFEISEIFNEIKKYELLLERKIAQQKSEELEIENKNLDEIARNNFLKAEEER